MLDDITLLQCYAETRADEAFTQLVSRHLDGVYSAALRRVGGDIHLAEDVTQEVFSELARNAAPLSRHPVLVGWLYTTTRNKAANAVRTEKRRQAREQKALDMSKMTSELATEANWSCVAPVLDEVIDQLSEFDRTAILLRFVDRRPFAEIGAMLRLTDDAARRRIDRALDKLRVLLNRRGIISSSAALSAAMTSNVVSASPAGLAANVAGSALAAATAAGNQTLTVFQIISMVGSAAGIAAIALLVAAFGTAAYELRATHRQEATLATANREFAAARERLGTLARDDQAATRKVAELQAAIAAVNLVSPVDAAAFCSSSADERSDARKFLAAFPQAEHLIREAEKPQLERIYGAFFRSADLALDQKNRLESALQNASLQNLAITAEGDFSLSLLPPTSDQLRALLGEATYRQFRDYRRLVPAQGVATQVATESAYAFAPLSSDQENRLAEIVADNSASDQIVHEINLAGVNWDSVLNQAAAANLSPAQLQALQREVEKIRYQIALASARQNSATANHP